MNVRPTNMAMALLNAASRNVNHGVTTKVVRHAMTDDPKRPFCTGYNVAEMDKLNVSPVVLHRAWRGK